MAAVRARAIGGWKGEGNAWFGSGSRERAARGQQGQETVFKGFITGAAEEIDAPCRAGVGKVFREGVKQLRVLLHLPLADPEAASLSRLHVCEFHFAIEIRPHFPRMHHL